LIGHTPALIPELTIGENLSHMAALAGIDRPSVARALSVVGLDEAAGVRVDASSHGMQRRVEIAALLMRRTRLLLLDEATSGLDHEATRLVDVLVERTIAAGGGVIMVSHDKGRLAGCHTLLEISGGRWPAQP
jgi:ABC-type multidrug transport system ATPase subunit